MKDRSGISCGSGDVVAGGKGGGSRSGKRCRIGCVSAFKVKNLRSNLIL